MRSRSHRAGAEVALLLLLLAIGCGPSDAQLVRIDALRADLPARRAALEAEREAFGERVCAGAVGLHGFDDGQSDLVAAEACLDDLVAGEELRGVEVDGIIVRCTRLIDRAFERADAGEARRSACERAAQDGAARAAALWQGHDVAHALVEAASADASDRHPARRERIDARAADVLERLAELRVAIQRVSDGIVGPDPLALVDALGVAEPLSVAVRAEARTFVDAAQALDAHHEEVVVGLTRTASYWAHLEVRRSERFDSEGWKEIDRDRYLRLRLNPVEDNRTRARELRTVTASEVTVRTATRDEGRVRDGVSRVGPIDEASLAALVSAWSRPGDPAEVLVERWVGEGPGDGLGVPTELVVTGRLVVSRKPVGVWPEDADVLVALPGQLP